MLDHGTIHRIWSFKMSQLVTENTDFCFLEVFALKSPWCEPLWWERVGTRATWDLQLGVTGTVRMKLALLNILYNGLPSLIPFIFVYTSFSIQLWENRVPMGVSGIMLIFVVDTVMKKTRFPSQRNSFWGYLQLIY